MHTLALTCPDQTIVLHGPLAAAPFRSAQRSELQELEDGTCRESFDLLFDPGSDPTAGLAGCSALLRRPDACLQLTAAAGGPTYETRILRAYWQTLPNSAGKLGCGARMVVLHPAGWAAPETSLPLSSSRSVRTTQGLLLANHSDSGHTHCAQIAAADVQGDLPADCCIHLQMQSAQGSWQDFWIFQQISSRALNPLLEGEACAAAAGSAAPTSSSACSGGQYQRAAWNSSSETRALIWTLNSNLLNGCAGQLFRPWLRLAAAPAYTDLWLRPVLMTGSPASPIALYRGVWQRLSAGQSLVELSPLPLPPGGDPQDAAGPLLLGLYAQGASAVYQLDVDFLHLSPLDGWRRLINVSGLGITHLQSVVDDGLRGSLYTETPGGRLPLHAPLGQPLRLAPNCSQSLYLLHDGPVDAETLLTITYRPRFRLVGD